MSLLVIRLSGRVFVGGKFVVIVALLGALAGPGALLHAARGCGHVVQAQVLLQHAPGHLLDVVEPPIGENPR